jgi:sugar (pentulose or hexulose) kinase
MHVLAGHYALESNAGLTAGVLEALHGLDELSGDNLAAALVGRGFELELAPGALAVLSGNPFFSPEQWSNWPPPTVVGLRPFHSGADVRRAGLIGVAYAVRGVVETLDRCCGTTSSPLVLTGGMSASRDWDQLMADVCRREVLVRPLEAIAGLAGAVLASGRDPDEVVASVPERRFSPDRHPAYEEGYRTYPWRYRAALEHQRAVGAARLSHGVPTAAGVRAGKC